jgi:spermidine synthase
MADVAATAPGRADRERASATERALFASIFAVAVAGLVYELVASTVASYLLGDSVTQFSTVIGCYLTAMGVGSALSARARGPLPRLVATFVRVELLLGVVGGFSAAALYVAFDRVAHFRVLLYGVVALVGALVGVELPLVMRILRARLRFRDLVATVFAFDYLGALVASVAFPLALVPHLGLVRTALMFGLVNTLVALWALRLFRDDVSQRRGLALLAVLGLAALAAGMALAPRVMDLAEERAFPDEVVYAKTSPYQRVVITRAPGDLRLYLNGNLQFSTRDEYRYHEALVHPALAALPRRAHVLILGGGDGLAAREVLKYPDVEDVTLVDLDPTVTGLFTRQEELARLNDHAFTDPKVRVLSQDAFAYLRQETRTFDFIVVDLPDPSSFSLGKLFSTSFYQALRPRLAPGGAAVVQATSPFVAPRAYWCVVSTLEQAGFVAAPFHVLVPSFGEWGFVLATDAPLAPAPDAAYPRGLRFVDAGEAAAMFQFPRDMARVATKVNRLDNQALVQYFEEEWAVYLR